MRSQGGHFHSGGGGGACGISVMHDKVNQFLTCSRCPLGTEEVTC